MRKKKNTIKEYLQYSSLGLEMALAISLFVFLGMQLDKWLQTEKPWGVLGFSLLGCALAIYLLIRRLDKINRSS